MLRDAGEFAGHIKRCEKDIRILKNATEGTQLHKTQLHTSVHHHCSVFVFLNFDVALQVS